ncbi:MAG TPA: PilT/PilU family type 4a pilus ATPase [Blastocatellia bacterium]|nr:PilT/PilU family type 4a pilus ATPase [Blastocatellia bacterium]
MPIHLDLLKTLSSHSRDVNAVAFSRDDSFLASGGGDRTVRIWEVASQQLLHTMEHGEWVNDVAFVPSGQAVASVARDGSIKMWSVKTGQLLGTIQAHQQNATSVTFSPDGSRLISGGDEGTIRVFNLREKKMEGGVNAHAGWVWHLAFTSLGDRLLSAGGDHLARVWRLGSKDKPVVLEGHKEEVLYASFSPDDRFVATSAKDGTVSFWESESGRLLYSFQAHEGAVNAVNFSPDGIHLGTAGADKTVRIWLAESGELVREIIGGYDYIAESVFSHDGRRMASCGGDGAVKIWEVKDKEAYAVAATRDPELEIEFEEEKRQAGASSYAVGQSLFQCVLASGLKLSLLKVNNQKDALGIGEPPRTAAGFSGDELSVVSGDEVPLLKLDLTTHSVTYDRTEGAATPWDGESQAATAAGSGSALERETVDAGATARAGFGDEFEIERNNGAASGQYKSFEKHGELLIRDRIASGHMIRLVRFDANTLYVLFDDRDDPTLVLKGDNMDVRDAGGANVFRMNLRSMEPVISRRGAAKENGNAATGPEAPRDPMVLTGLAESMARDGSEPRLHKILSKAVWAKASDIHVPSGAPIQIRRNGKLEHVEERTYTPDELGVLLLEVLTDEQRKRFLETNDLDFSYEIAGVGRFRANVCRQHRGIDGSFRVIPDVIPSVEALGLPPAVPPLTKHHQGLVLVTGPAGQGKSTTIATLVDLINSEKPLHIITVEDPIEFVHPIKCAVVNQREVGKHTRSFANALRAALREDPDVIVVGEMRDLETIALAITAAETGHLVFGTLMTTNAAQTVDRILDSFPAGQQSQIRTMLSESLKGIVSQQLVPAADGKGRVLACEVLLCNLAVANMIRERKTFQLGSVLQTSRNLGMQRMDDALFDLLQAARIAPETAMMYAHDPKAMEPRLKPGPAVNPAPRAR